MLPRSAALYLAVVQFLFVTTWTVYAIYLPQLAARAGIGREWVPWILLADQAVFAVMDVVAGFRVDRVRAGLARFGGWILAFTTLSCLALMIVPFIAASPVLLLALVFLWAVTSSALRSPPWALLSRYAARPSVPWLSTLMLTGTAVAAAIAPYLGIALREIDPGIPFVVSNVALLAAVGGLVWVERRLAGAQPHPDGESDPPFDPGAPDGRRLVTVFYVAVVVMAVGFQVHYSLNSANAYRQFSPAHDLQFLMPVFWIGFNLMMLPTARWVRRFGPITIMAIASALGALATLWTVLAGGLPSLVAAQLLAGGAWGTLSVGMFTAAIAFGRAGREGTMLGGMFAALALAAFARIGAYASDMVLAPAIDAALPWIPQLTWLAGGLLLASVVGVARRARI